MTNTERRLWYWLRAHRFQGIAFRRQIPIGPFIVDFVCHEHDLVIELDGGQHGESLHDARRDRWLRSKGYRVLRFWNSDVLNNRDGVLEIIANVLESSMDPPPAARAVRARRPPPQGGR